MSRRRPSEEFLVGMGGRIRARRHELRLTMRAVRDRCDLSLPFQSDVERGRQEPGAASLARWARVLGVTIDWIVHGDGATTDDARRVLGGD